MILGTKISFTDYSGKNVKVGVVDSGIDASHPDIRTVAGGIGIDINIDGEVFFTDNYTDRVGHGTACAWIIREKAPAAKLYSIKILNDDLSGSGKALAEALRWAANEKIKLVNLSLGTYDETYINDLRDACNYATTRGTIIVAAINKDGCPNYPADLQNVIRVSSTECCDHYGYYYRYSQKLEFMAKGTPQKVAWVDPRYIMRSGASFACAHITGIVALALEKFPEANYQEILDILIVNALSEEVSKSKPGKVSRHRKGSVQEKHKCSWVQKAALYPYNRWMKTLVRYKDLLNFEIVGIGDPPQMGHLGKDPGIVIGAKPIGISIVDSIEIAVKDADTLILGYPDITIRSFDPDILRKMLSTAICMNKNVIVSTESIKKICPDILTMAELKSLKICYPKAEQVLLSNDISQADPLDVPVLAVFGMGDYYETFLVDLALRKVLTSEGYKVAQLGWHQFHLLFDIDVLQDLSDVIISSMDPIRRIRGINERAHFICHIQEPDVLIVSIPNGVITQGWPGVCNGYGIPAMTLIHSTKPDACILSVIEGVSLRDIQNHIRVLEILSETKVIFVALNNLNSEAGTVISDHLSRELGIPVSDVVSEYGQRKLLDTILAYFTD